MMRHVCSLLLLAVLVHSKSTFSDQACIVSEWTSWEECRRTPVCHTSVPASWPLTATSHDMGDVVMTMIKQEKEVTWSHDETCRRDDTCPELAFKTTHGKRECTDGFAGEYPCHLVDLLSFVDFVSLGHPQDIRQHANDIWGWVDPVTHDEYAISCLYGGTSFVRVTDPVNPVVLGYLPSRTTPSTWHDVKVVNDHAYIVSEAEGHGMQVFDLTRLRNMSASTAELTADSEYLHVGQSHNIISNQQSQTVYIVGARYGDYPNNCQGGLHMVDVSEPKRPRFVGCYEEDGYTHDAECVIYHGPHVKYRHHEICFSYNENSLTIVDVTNKSHPYMVSKRGYEHYAYTHQGWVTEDHTVLLLDDELDEKNNFKDKRTRTYVWDVRDLEKPELKETYVSAQTAIDHNQYIKGDFTYQSNYEAGLRILHIDQDNYKLSEVAYFDTLPSHTTANFRGSWSNYPYFPSGNIALGSIDYGLFIVRPRYDDMQREVEKNNVRGTQTRSRQIVTATKPATCPALEDFRSCQPEPCY